MTTTTTLDRPLPRSYMSEEEKTGLKKEGLNQNDIFVFESQAAHGAGDEEASWAWLALAELPGACKKILKIGCGEEFLKTKGFSI
jgi:hypothetical protein